ncbi:MULTISPECIES: hypothetical protein [Paraburkholderia]|uniref:Uncharacterized protein n=1 Tax=Paraburkholderia podalyriae TaxID=1938811 RepID=A0ABR7Q2A0_9BURK|nr:hypothetical protein [Paraburkholderia podalyriae]MBC8752685.1 hypothetical protein [Paraburkholderia podalyriae]
MATDEGNQGKRVFDVTNWLVEEFARSGTPPVWVNAHSPIGAKADTLLFGGLDAISVEEDGTVRHWTQRGQPDMPHRNVATWTISSATGAMKLASTLALSIDYRPEHKP